MRPFNAGGGIGRHGDHAARPQFQRQVRRLLGREGPAPDPIPSQARRPLLHFGPQEVFELPPHGGGHDNLPIRSIACEREPEEGPRGERRLADPVRRADADAPPRDVLQDVPLIPRRTSAGGPAEDVPDKPVEVRPVDGLEAIHTADQPLEGLPHNRRECVNVRGGDPPERRQPTTGRHDDPSVSSSTSGSPRPAWGSPVASATPF